MAKQIVDGDAPREAIPRGVNSNPTFRNMRADRTASHIQDMVLADRA